MGKKKRRRRFTEKEWAFILRGKKPPDMGIEELCEKTKTWIDDADAEARREERNRKRREKRLVNLSARCQAGDRKAVMSFIRTWLSACLVSPDVVYQDGGQRVAPSAKDRP